MGISNISKEVLMTSKEFKKNFHFRNCADRNCFNCKYRWREPDAISGPGEISRGRNQCWFDRENPRTKFTISNFTVCDNWERDKNVNNISVV